MEVAPREVGGWRAANLPIPQDGRCPKLTRVRIRRLGIRGPPGVPIAPLQGFVSSMYGRSRLKAVVGATRGLRRPRHGFSRAATLARSK